MSSIAPIPSRCRWNIPFHPFFLSIAFYPRHSKLRKLQKLLITSELCCKHTRDPLCHSKMAPLHVCKELGPETNYQATRYVLLNEMLKPLAYPTVKHHSTTFQRRSTKSNGCCSKCWSRLLCVQPWRANVFFVHACFSNETVSQTTVTIWPLRMFRLKHETMNVWRSNLFAMYISCRGKMRSSKQIALSKES